jgi:hypothetical protein
MEKKILKIPAILDRTNRKKDRSYSLTFVSDLEIGKKDRELIDDLWQQTGWLIFATNDFEEVEVPNKKAEREDGKSYSERFRNVLFVYYKQNEAKLKDKYPLFQDFYAQKMEKEIETVKSKLI